MSYKPESPIYKEAFENEERISQKCLGEEQQKIISIDNNIKRSEREINQLRRKLENFDEKKRMIIYNLRKIMENWENHKDNLIFNPLNDESDKNYKKEISKLQDLENDKIHKQWLENMKKERESINENLKIKRKSEKMNETVQDHAIEKGRKKIISLCLDVIKDNKIAEERISYLQGRIKEIEQNYKNQSHI